MYDVSGAGDTVIATLGVVLAAGASLPDAVRIANEAAGVVVGKLGTAVVQPHELSSQATDARPGTASPRPAGRGLRHRADARASASWRGIWCGFHCRADPRSPASASGFIVTKLLLHGRRRRDVGALCRSALVAGYLVVPARRAALARATSASTAVVLPRDARRDGSTVPTCWPRRRHGPRRRRVFRGGGGRRAAAARRAVRRMAPPRVAAPAVLRRVVASGGKAGVGLDLGDGDVRLLVLIVIVLASPPRSSAVSST